MLFTPGGTFASARELRAVAGYSERYQVWGFEDADLQWKLDEAFGTNGIPDKERLRVLHLDHPKGYFDINASEQNKSILAERKRRGIAYAVAEDTQRGSV
ncbi:MAG: galactosyltransferase-related protein [Candidatus Woesearchaeota archaeon]